MIMAAVFRSGNNPGRIRMHMSAAHFQPPASAIVRVRSVGASSAWFPLDVKLRSEKENICTALKQFLYPGILKWWLEDAARDSQTGPR